MALDPSIPMQVQSFDMIGMLGNGSKLAQHWQQQKTESELNRLYKETGGDLSKMMELGKQSQISHFVMPELQSRQSAQHKALLDQQKTISEIGKVDSETLKNTQVAQGDKLKNAQTLLTNANQALYAATRNGDANAVKLALNNAKTAGVLDEDTYNRHYSTVESLGNNPEQLKAFALNIQQAYAQNPEKYNFTTADNVLNNETSIANNTLNNETSRVNNQNSVNASIYSTDVGAQTAQAKLSQDQNQFDANLYIQQNKPLDYFTAADGTRYAVYANGQGIPITNGQGAPIKEKLKTAETPVQKMERQEKTIDFANGAKSAAEAAQLAAGLANDLEGMNSAAGGFGLMAKVPGSDAKAFSTKLETLKSNVFLQQVGLMKGMGALTDAEGARLEKSIAALDLSLSPVDLQKNLTQITQILSQAAKTSSQKAQLYSPNSQATNRQPQPSAPASTSVMDFFK